MKSRRDRIHDHYEPRIVPSRRNYRVLDWASQKSQFARFSVLAEQLDLTGRTLLDVGSGLGDLWTYLRGCGIDVRYTGVDLVEKMVDRARELHPDVTFVAADIFGDCPFRAGSFDVVYCSGMFNLKLGNNRKFLAEAVEHFFRLAQRHVVFNCLHRRAAWPYFGKYFYFKPEWVLQTLEPYDCDVRLVDNYLYNDFTVVCAKRDQA